MAVRTVKNISRPPLLQSRDVRKLIPKAGGEKQSPGGNGEATVKTDAKPGGEALNPGDGSVDDLAA